MFRLACLSIGRINSVNLSLRGNHYSSLIQRQLSTTSIGWQKQSNTVISTSESSGKKYTRPPPIDLKSVRTNQALGSEEEKSGRGKTSVLGAIFLLTIPLLTFGLGVWQVKRRQEKLDLIAFLKSRTDSQPVELPSDPKQLDNLLVENEYRPFKLRGHFLHSREILITMRHDLSQHTHVPGGQVITPFVLSSNPNTIVLVNRGFVPYTHFSPVSRTQSQVEGEVEVVGLLRSNEPINTFTPVNIPPNEWHYRDIDLMAKTLGTKPIFLDALSTTGLKSDNYPLPKQTAIQLRNDHLMYLITWFSLSLITSALWWRRFKSLLIRVKP